MMAMTFSVNQGLLSQAREALAPRKGLYWIVGGAGSGKSSVCRALSERYGLLVYDMDAQIYGAYHSRFSQERHPANWAWASAENSLAWMLDMDWEAFDSFNQAALAEYLDLLTSDLEAIRPETGLVIDGGVCNPAVLAKAMPIQRMVCMAAPYGTSARLWQQSEERSGMKAAIDQLPHPEAAWRKFLEFDQHINATILKECLENEIPVCLRDDTDSVEDLASWVAHMMGIG
jgi:hypothetical protein